MTIIKASPEPELVSRATDLVELIRKHAPWQEENRTIHEEVLQGIADAGLLKLRVPTRYGGNVADTRTVVDALAELGRGDGSVAWTIGTLTLGSWLAGLFPDEAQDEIFADPNVRIAGSVSPNGTVVPTDGGFVLNGRWPFNTGAPHAQWDIHSVLLATEDGQYVPAAAAVPMSDLMIVDDWNTVGLRATGSVTTVANDVFVPANRVLPMLPLLMEGKHLSEENAPHQAWQTPFMALAAVVGSAPGLGMARAAQDFFYERLPGRKITYTFYEQQNEAPVTHLEAAEAALKADEAEFYLHRAADRLDNKTAAGEQWTMEERALGRMDPAAVVLRAKQAVDILADASGGSSIYTKVPIQRVERDIQALNLNGIMHPNTSLETYGRILCGQEPNSQYV